jgi:coenzyme F420-reducing hydrogenase delta subunit
MRHLGTSQPDTYLVVHFQQPERRVAADVAGASRDQYVRPVMAPAEPCEDPQVQTNNQTNRAMREGVRAIVVEVLSLASCQHSARRAVNEIHVVHSIASQLSLPF